MQVSTTQKRWLMTAVRLGIVLLVLWFVGGRLMDGLSGLRGYDWHFAPWWLAAAGGFTLLGYLPGALFWYRLLLVLGQDAQLGESLRAYYVSQVGKYVPGKVMVVVIRAGMIRSHRVDTTAAALSVFLETLTFMAVGSFLAAAVLAAMSPEKKIWLVAAVVFMMLAGLPTFPPIFRRLAGLAGVVRSNPAMIQRLQGLGYGTLVTGWLAMSVGWIMMGLSLWAVLRAMGLPGIELLPQIPFYVAGVAMGKVAGFISLIPAGLGVTDLTLLGILSEHFRLVSPEIRAAAAATVAAITLRLVWLLSEVGFSAILYSIGLWRSRWSQPSAAATVPSGQCAEKTL